VDLSSDKGPGVSASFAEGEFCRGIDLHELISQLEASLDGAPSLTHEDPEPGLISHLSGAWGEMTSRAFSRADSSESIEVCVGLKAAHYYLSGREPFEKILSQSAGSSERSRNPFGDNVHFLPNAGQTHDVWDDAFDVGGKIPKNPKFEDPELTLFSRNQTQARPANEESYVSFSTIAADMSPSGYRLRWSEPFPPNLQTGELIGLKDESDPRWCLAVARWIRQSAEGPFMGVELLAPQARPIAIRIVQSKGSQMEFQRAFILPELRPLGRPATLITPATPFKGGQKILVKEKGAQNTAQLGDCLLRTGSFNQFTFRVLDGYLEKPGGRHNIGNQINKNQNGLR
jgi:hypothetical protein